MNGDKSKSDVRDEPAMTDLEAHRELGVAIARRLDRRRPWHQRKNNACTIARLLYKTQQA